MMARRAGTVALWAVGVLSLALAPFVGPQPIAWEDVIGQGGGMGARIFWELRLPRVILAWGCGATLALCGAMFQALFRNPLAEPAMLGVSSGASFGAALFVYLGWSLPMQLPMLGLTGMSLAAFVGALSCVMALQGVARLRPDPRGTTLLLAGVAFNFFFSSFVMIVQYLGSYHDSYRLLRWTLGGLQPIGMAEGARIAPALLLALGTATSLSRELDLMLCGPEIAASRGVALGRVRTVLFTSVSLCVALCVALCGPVAFVGLMAPHLARMIVGGGHRELIPASALLGGAFLTACDGAARTLWAPMELPVGIVTSFLGAPFFLWLLLRRRGDAS